MKLFILGLFVFVSANGFAGPGHGHSHGPVDTCKSHATKNLEESSIKIGQCNIVRFIKAKKLDKSWESAKHLKSITKVFNKNKEWVVSFQNEKGVKGKILYIFLTMRGGFIAANFTGK